VYLVAFPRADGKPETEDLENPRPHCRRALLKDPDRYPVAQACAQGLVGVRRRVLAGRPILLVVDHVPGAVSMVGDTVTRVRAADHRHDRGRVVELARLVDAHLGMDERQRASQMSRPRADLAGMFLEPLEPPDVAWAEPGG
jgi:hypothetical protein